MPNDKAKLPRLVQLIRDNLERDRGIRSEASGDEATIYLYDMIDDYWGISAQAFVKELNALTAKTIHMRVNSPGGDVFAARAMVTAIRAHSSKIIAHVDGIAASAATWVALAAAEVEISQGAMFMIHNSMSIAWGNKADFLATAALLEKIDQSIIADYERKTKKGAEQLAAWMDAETWFTAEEAKTNGFADRVVDGATAENRWNLSAFENVPKQLLAPAPKDTTDEDIARAREHLENRMKLLDPKASRASAEKVPA
jgi:ATP-dependent Clp protease protease subunit